MLIADTFVLTTDPAKPWSLPQLGLPALIIVAVLLIALTLWTYLGVTGPSWRRIVIVLGLRLAALLLAFLAILRPSLASRDELHTPSTLVLAADYSESMNIHDESDGRSRWQSLQRTLADCEPILQRLREEHNVNVVLKRFAGDTLDYDPDAKADGKRTDTGQMLNTLHDTYRTERYLRGLIVLSDGADNGTRFSPLPLAEKWRNLPCPVHTVGFGKPTTSEKQNDIIVTALNPDPAPVPVKGDLTVKASVDAPGFEGKEVRVHVYFDDEEVVSQNKTLALTQGNEINVKCIAPAKPGEIKVSFKIDPLPGEQIKTNNEMSTYLTVSREGLSVLVVDKERFPEPQLLCDALRPDPRIRLYTVWFRGSEPANVGQKDLFEFDRQRYDVIILGDLTSERLRSGNPEALAKIREMVRDKGAGFLMMGGYDSFGSSWRNTPVADALPVELIAPGQVDGRVKLSPTEPGLRHFLMRLADKPEDSIALWKNLELRGMTQLGPPKPLATVYAESSTKAPILVGQTYGSGRTLAFAGDTTHLWIRDEAGLKSHDRFWKQVVLWLAKQDETEGSVWIKPDARRLAAGDKLGFSSGLRGKGGVELKEALFDARLIAPGNTTTPLLISRDKSDQRGTVLKTEAPGEYRIVVTSRGKDVDGQEVSGEATARFLVYQDEAELARRAADHEFLKRLASSGGGRFMRPDELASFLRDLESQPLARSRPKANVWPNWQLRPRSDPFLLGDHLSALFLSGVLVCFVLFVALLSAEWFLRRRWGMV